ncbi:MAG: Gfo/Idh/MocA family oxidoreductase [Polyangiaceae bacterium]
MPLTIAIVGCGKIADGQYEEIAKMPELARVVAVCDREGLMAEQMATRYAIPAYYDDYARMLSVERPDVVHITTPPGSHAGLARAAIDAGAHVYVEKPLTMSYPDSKALVEHAVSRGRKLTIGYTYFFDPPALEIRDLRERGVLGDIVHVEAFFGYGLGGPFGKVLMGDARHWVHGLPGKLLHNNIDHLLNKALEFVPDAEPRIMAIGNKLRPERFGDTRDDFSDELRLIIAGERTSFYGTFTSHVKPVGHFMRVYGTRATAHADFVSRTVTLEPDGTLPSAIGRVVPAFQHSARFLAEGMKNVGRFAKSDFHFFSGLNKLIRLFYESIQNDSPPPIAYNDILRLSSWLDEIFRQAPQGGSAAQGGAK